MPTRIATNGPDVLFTLDTPTARAWLEGDQAQALGSDDRFMQVVDELDRHEVFAATIRVAHDPFYDLRESRDRNRDRLMQDRDQYLLIRESCDRVAIGFSAEPAGSFTTHVVYQFPDEQTAAAALPSVQETWSSGWARAWVPIGDVIDAVHSVVPKGDLVVVSVDAGDYAREMTGHVGVSAPLVCDGDA